VREEAASTGTGHYKPEGKLMRSVHAFKALMAALKGGGVWAALTVLLITCGWLAWELQEANKRIIDILVAIKMAPTAEAPAVLPTPTASSTGHAPGDFDEDSGFPSTPREILQKYNRIYRPQLEQRMAPREGQAN